MEFLTEHIKPIAFVIGLFIGSFAVMFGFNLFTGRFISDIKNELYKKYKETKEVVEAPIDKT